MIDCPGYIGMVSDTNSAENTRDRLLASARDVFAEKGFSDATVKEICELADANIASVNYYFGSKEKLYTEAWQSAFHESLRAHPPDGGVPQDAPPEERLRGRIRAMIHHVADEDHQAFRIADKEMANPTCLLDELQRECVTPLMDGMRSVVRELLGPDATEKHVHLCQASITAQCFGVIRHIRMHRRSEHPLPPPMEYVIQDIDGYAEHVGHFALAGIRAIRDLIEAERTERAAGTRN